MIPSVLRGRAMHHSVAFNPNRNEYLVAFDWDMNYDGVSDHLYAARLDQAGKIVDKKVLNVSANIPGWVSGKSSFIRRSEFLVLTQEGGGGAIAPPVSRNNYYIVRGIVTNSDRTLTVGYFIISQVNKAGQPPHSIHQVMNTLFSSISDQPNIFRRDTLFLLKESWLHKAKEPHHHLLLPRLMVQMSKNQNSSTTLKLVSILICI